MGTIFILKLFLGPSIVAGGTAAGKRWGHQVGGLVAGFPNTSSPILLFLAIERGPVFAAHAAVGTLLGLVALAAYGLTYVWASTRFKWWLALPLGWCSFLLVAWSLRRAELNPLWATLAAVAALGLSLKLMPSLEGAASLPPVRKKNHLLFRIAAAVALILCLTGAAGWLGPTFAGVLSAFPVASSVLTAGAHREAGPVGAKWVLMGIYLALLALILFTALLPFLLPRLHMVPAFALATTAGFLAQALIIWRRHQCAWAVSRL